MLFVLGMFAANLIVHESVPAKPFQVLAKVDSNLVPFRDQLIDLNHFIPMRADENTDPISFFERGAIAFAGEFVEERPYEKQSQDAAECRRKEYQDRS